MNGKMKKIITSALALTMVAGMSIGGTYAWLTSKPEDVVNTFSVGKVNITLDEIQWDTENMQTGSKRVLSNKYHLLPGHEYTKDPTVHVTAGSEDCYVFVQIQNGLTGSIPDTQRSILKGKSIEKQITDLGWKVITENVAGEVYYKTVSKEAADDGEDLKVFDKFQINHELTNADMELIKDKNITVTAYAIQQDGFTGETAVTDAWNAVKDVVTEVE